MPLTDDVIRTARPGAKPRKMSDERGLFLLVSSTGGKWWRFRYGFAGKYNALALGTYPAVGLEEARKARDEARQLLAQGIDPAHVRRQEKSRDRAVALQTMDASTVKVSASIDGTVEIWKGRAVMCLSPDEARAVKALLNKLTA